MQYVQDFDYRLIVILHILPSLVFDPPFFLFLSPPPLAFGLKGLTSCNSHLGTAVLVVHGDHSVDIPCLLGSAMTK